MSEETEENPFKALVKRNVDALENVEALLSAPAAEPVLDMSPIETAYKRHEQRSAEILAEALNLSQKLTGEQREQLQAHSGKVDELGALVQTLRPRWWARRTALAIYGLFVGLVLAGSFSWFTISTNMNPYMCNSLSGVSANVALNGGTHELGCFIAFKASSQPI